MMLSSMGWHFATAWLGIALDYLLAAGAIVLGVWLAEFFDLAATNPLAWLLRPLRFVGYVLIIGGAAYGYGTWREQNAVSACISAAKLASVAGERDALKDQVARWKQAADTNRKNAERMQADRERTNGELAQWTEAAGRLSKEVRTCRAATGDDDRRLCGLVEGRAPGCRLR